LKAGRRDEFEAILLTFEADVARRRSPTGHILAASLRSWLAYADGRLEEWLTIDREMAEFADEQGIATFARIFRSLNVARGAYYLGDLPPEFGIRCGHGMVTASQFQGNNKDAVAFLDASLSSCTADSEWEFWNYTIVGELAFRVRHEEAARLVLQRLQDLPLEVSGHSWSICVSRLRGDCFAVIGQPETASANYEEALRVCSRLGFRPELALTHLNYAELLAEHYPDKLGAAAEYLGVALGELGELKMNPALNRALILREALEAGRPTAGNQPDHLTRREADVLALVAEGLSNKQIAEYLVLSVRTVERHLTNSYRKIGAHSKAQATAYALSKGLHSISSGSGKTT
jgi:DNA-binding CsgD family transcriptional regulator